MAFQTLEGANATSIEGILSFPLTGDFWFWGEILLAIFVIITLFTFFEERARLGRGNLLSSFAIASLITIILSFIGTLFNIVTKEIFLIIIVFGIIFIVIWFVRGE